VAFTIFQFAAQSVETTNALRSKSQYTRALIESLSTIKLGRYGAWSNQIDLFPLTQDKRSQQSLLDVVAESIRFTLDEPDHFIPGRFELVSHDGDTGDVVWEGDRRDTKPGKDGKITSGRQVRAGEPPSTYLEFHTEKSMHDLHLWYGSALEWWWKLIRPGSI